MKKLLVVLAVISLTGSVASAQKVHSDNLDIRFTAGVRIPIEHSRANSGEVMSLTYGKYNDKGFGLSFNIWRFKLSVLPSVHYFITDNYREVNNKSYTTPTGTESDFTDQARSWQFSIQGGLSFSF